MSCVTMQTDPTSIWVCFFNASNALVGFLKEVSAFPISRVGISKTPIRYAAKSPEPEKLSAKESHTVVGPERREAGSCRERPPRIVNDG